MNSLDLGRLQFPIGAEIEWKEGASLREEWRLGTVWVSVGFPLEAL